MISLNITSTNDSIFAHQLVQTGMKGLQITHYSLNVVEAPSKYGHQLLSAIDYLLPRDIGLKPQD